MCRHFGATSDRKIDDTRALRRLIHNAAEKHTPVFFLARTTRFALICEEISVGLSRRTGVLLGSGQQIEALQRQIQLYRFLGGRLWRP